ncbi:hypothetical protein PR202_ga28096 [Eleusine coracana subsp. coracana]|uniref:Uncharacterized protein n=1 Tax=Eleusine coracana subsp. coracana TaxID=191504 RepID=A0AAV5DHQ7_ELECO|nr:hypothetical protein PR202_ga28096 [Eleusine coracana subsp. coracana]
MCSHTETEWPRRPKRPRDRSIDTAGGAGGKDNHPNKEVLMGYGHLVLVRLEKDLARFGTVVPASKRSHEIRSKAIAHHE